MSTICSLDAKKVLKPSTKKMMMSQELRSFDDKKTGHFDSFLGKDATVAQMQEYFQKSQTLNNSP